MSNILDLVKLKIHQSLLSISIKDELSKSATNYLHSFGYLSGLTINSSDNDLKGRIQQAQNVLNVPSTGIVDEITVKAMQVTPRCGCSDHQSASTVLNQWLKSRAKTGLTYHIIKYVTGLTQQEQENVISNSFSAWEKICGLKTFRKQSTDADIIIDASASREEEFGTAGNVLAWAYLPDGNNWTQQLLMKFDLAERWVLNTTGNAYEILIETVTKHECGHLWGLDHTNTKGQLMYPTYNVAITGPQPGYDIDQAVLRYDLPSVISGPNPPAVNPFANTVITNAGKFYKIVPV